MTKRDRQKSMFRNAIINGLIDSRTLPHPLTRKQRAAMAARVAAVEAGEPSLVLGLVKKSRVREEEIPF